MPKHSELAASTSTSGSASKTTHERRTWVFDATFLRSNWSCIYGAGCKGVLDDDATELAQGCCSTAPTSSTTTTCRPCSTSLTRLEPRHWQNYKKGHNKGVLETEDGATKTRVVEGCVHLPQPARLPRRRRCALHIAALEAGERHIDWKPDVCWQLPLRLEHHTDDNGYVTSTPARVEAARLGRGRRRLPLVVHRERRRVRRRPPAYQYLRDEIIEMVGQAAYDQMVVLLERPKWTPLPHPATRR